MKKYVRLTKEFLQDIQTFAIASREDPKLKAYVDVSNEIGIEWPVEIKVRQLREDGSYVVEWDD